MTRIERTQYTVTKWAENGAYDAQEFKLATSEVTANCYGSKITTGDGDNLHAPAIDLDFPCRILNSSTPGHSHLYIDHPMTWNDYKKLLKTMMEVGLIEKGFYNSSIKKGQTMLRKPSIPKKNYDKPENPVHMIRLKEITQALSGLVTDMDGKAPEVEPTEISPF